MSKKILLDTEYMIYTMYHVRCDDAVYVQRDTLLSTVRYNTVRIIQ